MWFSFPTSARGILGWYFSSLWSDFKKKVTR